MNQRSSIIRDMVEFIVFMKNSYRFGYYFRLAQERTDAGLNAFICYNYQIRFGKQLCEHLFTSKGSHGIMSSTRRLTSEAQAEAR